MVFQMKFPFWMAYFRIYLPTNSKVFSIFSGFFQLVPQEEGICHGSGKADASPGHALPYKL